TSPCRPVCPRCPHRVRHSLLRSLRKADSSFLVASSPASRYRASSSAASLPSSAVISLSARSTLPVSIGGAPGLDSYEAARCRSGGFRQAGGGGGPPSSLC